MDNVKWVYNFWNCAWVKVKGNREAQVFKVNDLCFTYKQVKYDRARCLNQIEANLEVTLHPDNLPVKNDYMILEHSMNEFILDMNIRFSTLGRIGQIYNDMVGDRIAKRKWENKEIKKSKEEVKHEMKYDKD